MESTAVVMVGYRRGGPRSPGEGRARAAEWSGAIAAEGVEVVTSRRQDQGERAPVFRADETGAVCRAGVVVIGRNEGERLAICLSSLTQIPDRVYVDSQSSDGSVGRARAAGFAVRELHTPPKLSAARGRNAGRAHLATAATGLAYVQMVDGDCEVRPGWFDAGIEALDRDPGLALVFGRCRERHPDRSIYNALCDDEWNVSVGPATNCGGNMMVRLAALDEVGGFKADIIAAEDTDLAQRLRDAGWRLECLPDEMVLHDAAIVRFGQWWTRTRRSGHAFAELAARHRSATDPDWTRLCLGIAAWGGAFPLMLLGSLAAALAKPAWLAAGAAILGLWLLQIARVACKLGRSGPRAVGRWTSAIFLTMGKVPQMLGILQFLTRRITRRQGQLIEYKRPKAIG